MTPERVEPVLLTKCAYKFPLTVPDPVDKNPTALSAPVVLLPEPKLYIPCAALLARLAPPISSVLLPAPL